ncbi:hypothetical protein HII31_02715, partial [Pseudocercospora fuligena]
STPIPPTIPVPPTTAAAASARRSASSSHSQGLGVSRGTAWLRRQYADTLMNEVDRRRRFAHWAREMRMQEKARGHQCSQLRQQKDIPDLKRIKCCRRARERHVHITKTAKHGLVKYSPC